MSAHRDTGLTSRLASSSYRHAYLLVSLVLVLVVRPFLVDSRISPWLLDAFMQLTLIAGVFATISSRVQGVVTALLAMVAIGARILWRVDSDIDNVLLSVSLLASLALYANIALLFLRNLFTGRERITADTIYSAVSVYLLLGLVWTLAFAMLELTAPGSFSFPEALTGPEDQFDRLIGFSYTTLTTLGYGNIYPTTPQADALANAEAITGTLYLTVVVSRLIGLQISQRPKPEAE